MKKKSKTIIKQVTKLQNNQRRLIYFQLLLKWAKIRRLNWRVLQPFWIRIEPALIRIRYLNLSHNAKYPNSKLYNNSSKEKKSFVWNYIKNSKELFWAFQTCLTTIGLNDKAKFYNYRTFWKKRNNIQINVWNYSQ